MLDDPRDGRTRGRQAEASANDERILAAALNVLTANPRAPIAEVAAEAGVGVASLYRRFSGRDDLVRRLALFAMAAIEQAARDALARVDDDPWAAFIGFLVSAMEAGAGSMSAFAGTFRAGKELNDAGASLGRRIDELLARTQEAGAVRPDLTGLDVLQLFEMLRAIRVGAHERSNRLRLRYIEMLTPALRAPMSAPLTVRPPAWDEVLAVWNPRGRGRPR
ncbi:MAG: TetR/AcrR family transcriptional regulator [Candidatus Dormibacteraeota bacterium]|nr:TetR/AcrR family transcriptional regulator [Candidatus Dormibacteraeota bacterium]